MRERNVEIDIPCDVLDHHELGMPYALLIEARSESHRAARDRHHRRRGGSGARVDSLTQQGDHTVVDLELLPGDSLDYAQALQRSHLLAT